MNAAQRLGSRLKIGGIEYADNAVSENIRCKAKIEYPLCRTVYLLHLELFVQNDKPVRCIACDGIRKILSLIL